MYTDNSEDTFLEHFTYKGKKYRLAVNDLDLKLAIEAKASGAFSGHFVYDHEELYGWDWVNYQTAKNECNWIMLVCLGSVETKNES